MPNCVIDTFINFAYCYKSTMKFVPVLMFNVKHLLYIKSFKQMQTNRLLINF